MNDSEIIKGFCNRKLCEPALKIINRQQVEIERLTQENNALNGNTEKYIEECENRSRQIAEGYRKEIKSEAVREFAEKLAINLAANYSDKYCHWIDDTIYELLEEMGCNDG